MTQKARTSSRPSSGRLAKERHSRHILLLPGVKWFVPSIWRYLRWPARRIAGFLAAAAVLTFGSHLIGAWYASRTETDQEAVWSTYLNHEIRIQVAEYGMLSWTTAHCGPGSHPGCIPFLALGIGVARSRAVESGPTFANSLPPDRHVLSIPDRQSWSSSHTAKIEPVRILSACRFRHRGPVWPIRISLGNAVSPKRGFFRAVHRGFQLRSHPGVAPGRPFLRSMRPWCLCSAAQGRSELGH
jgi:hypothetical protein